MDFFVLFKNLISLCYNISVKENYIFKNKVVLITGASRRIGKATAVKFGQLGANVIINYCKDEKAANNVTEIIKKITPDSRCFLF